MRSKLLLATVVGALTIGFAPASASASASCSYGDARAQFETLPLTIDETPPPCQYRLFWHGRTVTFQEGDFFLGGLVRRIPYGETQTRSQAIATLEATSVRVWLAAVTSAGTGPLVEQSVDRTAIKSNNYAPFGQHVWAQWGVILHLPAGEYLSVTRHAPIAGRTMSTVRLVVAPA